MMSAAGAIELAATGTNSVTGTAYAHGDSFATENMGTTTDSLYSGVWAHAYVPIETAGINFASSERTVPARTETRTPTLGSNKYNLVNAYGETTVIAKASKTGVLGSGEAFSEASALSLAGDAGATNQGEVSGDVQLVVYATHSGTGTAEASATGSASYDSMMSAGQVDASGSVDGSVALNIENNYGGSVKGAAWEGSQSFASSSVPSSEEIASMSFEYLSLTSGRNALSTKSDIQGNIAGDTTASGFYAITGTPGRYGNIDSSASGDLSGIATTYKLGDSIIPEKMHYYPYALAPGLLATQYAGIATNEKGSTGDLHGKFLDEESPASAFLLSAAFIYPSDTSQESDAWAESMTSAGVTRTLADTNEAYGASYIDNGALSATANTASVAGGSPITLASASLDTIFMGSGAHLVSRLTGANPASTADLTMHSYDEATDAPGSSGLVEIVGAATPSTGTGDSAAKATDPSYSPTGTSDDATGSYLTAMNIDGTALHTKDTAAGSMFTSDSKMIASDIDEINIWSWIAGSDPRTHAESKYGQYP
ncbi:MAG TPA: hypothetical protein VN455_08345, partial [Methanotrichaceae archaeon]|nr:hypothetical protein [Methanotrichaceae archaeon]